MLKVPALTQIESVTIFADDTLFYLFYPVASAPSIRLDEHGKPIFLLVKYAFSDEDRLRNPSAPAGGGYLNFDIQFDVPPETLAKVRAQLQPQVDAEWQRLKNGTAAEQAQPGVVGTTTPPQVAFGEPTWTGGKVSLDAPQAAELVSARVAEAQPSLLAGNIAVFSLDLTSDGATFMQKTLATPSGAGASDLTVLQVAYDLTFWARLPAAHIHIHADSQKIHEYLHKQMEGRGVDNCTTYDFDHTDITTDTASVTGAIDVQIDTGSGSLPPSVMDELRRYSLDLVKQMIQSQFFTETPPEQQQPGDDTSDHPAPPPGSSSQKYLKQTYDSATMTLDFDLQQSSVVEWPIHPQATLETFFKGMSAEQLKQFVRVIDLEDDFFKSLEVNARAFTSFGDGVVSNVEVQVHYEGTDENGMRAEKNQTFTFTSNTPETWKVSLIGSEREYQYRYRVGFVGQEPGAFSEWERSKSPDLNVAIPNPGRISITAQVGDVDFTNLVDNVQVQLAYSDPELGVPREDYTLILTPTKQGDRYDRLIYQPLRHKVQYHTRFKLKSGDVREDPKWTDCNGSQILINQAFSDILRVNLIPGGDGWDDVVQTMVDLRYKDIGNQYEVEETIPLKSRDEFKSWRVFLKNKAIQDFQYRWTASFKSGHFEQSDWQSGSGETTVPIILKRPGIRVAILADGLDFSTCPLTEITLHYHIGGVDEQETFVFRDKTPQVWYIDTPEGAPIDFTYQVTHSPLGRGPLALPEARETDTVVVLPQYRAPKPGKLSVQVIGTQVNYADTPIVAVDLAYVDEPNNIHEIGALTLGAATPTLPWTIDVKDVNNKQFSYQLTYYKADGTALPADLKSQEIPRIIVPRLMA